MFKKIIYACLTIIACIGAYMAGFYLFMPDPVVLDDVSLKELAETSKGSNMAIMIGDKDGNYSTYKESGFPNNKLYRFNNEKSGCVDASGNTVSNVLSYNNELSKVSLRTTQSVSCYLYFDFIPEPTVTVTLNESDALNVTATILSDKDGTYCVNTSSNSNALCLASGSITANESVITDRFAVSGTYYVHVEDDLEQVGHSSAVNVNLIYNQIEYIESTGTQYIDTGYSAPNGFKTSTKVNITSFPYSGLYVVGSHNTSSPYGRNGIGIEGNVWELGTGDTYPHSSGTISLNNDYVLEGSSVKGNSYLKVNGTQVISSTDSSTRSSLNVLIFANQYYTNKNKALLPAKMYFLKLYSDTSTLVRDLYPVVRIADNVIGMYDKVNNVFYTNSGTGNFNGGNVIEIEGIGTASKVVINNGDESTNNKTVTLDIYSRNASTMCISESTTCTNYINYATSGSYTFSGEGIKTVYVTFKDSLGNIIETVNDSIEILLFNSVTLGEYLLDNDLSGKTAYSGLYRYTGTTANNYVDLGGVLYRVIGVTDGSTTNTDLGLTANQVKLIKAESIGDYAWHSVETTDVRWNVSGYTVADLYTTLQGNTVLGSSSVIPSAWTSKISSVKWYVGDVQNAIGSSTVFGLEDDATTQSTSKVGLMYLSDYLYAFNYEDTTDCNDPSCIGWLKLNNTEWTMTRCGEHAWMTYPTASLIAAGFYLTGVKRVRPVIYLSPDVIYTGKGDGSENSPYELAIPPVVETTINNNKTENATLTITSNESGTYCVNTSSDVENMSNCVFSGSITADTPVTTNVFAANGRYYVHVKGSKYTGISSAQEISLKLTFGEYLLQNDLSGKTAYSGLYRYTGTSANNYVDLGGVLYRVIGVTDESTINTDLGLTANQVKLIKAESIGSYVWHSSSTDARWNVSGYTVATLYTTLQGNSVLGNTSVIPSAWTSKLSSVNWYVGDVNTTTLTNAETVFGYEDNVTTQSNAKVGLMYLSDWYYAYNAEGTQNCYSDTYCVSWMTDGNDSYEWTMSYYDYYDNYDFYGAWRVHDTGKIHFYSLFTEFAIRPVIYLNADVLYSGEGNGSSGSPYELST